MSRPATFDQPQNLAPFVNGCTIGEASLSRYVVKRLTAEKLVKPAGVHYTKQRGRPAHIFKLTDKGRKRAKRAGLL